MTRATIIKCVLAVVLMALTWLNESMGLNMPSTELANVSGALAGFVAAELFQIRKDKKKTDV